MSFQKMSEHIHYEIIPAKDMIDLNEQAWDVRFLEGDFVETVVRYGNIGFNEEKDALTFNFIVISSPIKDLTVEDETLQLAVGDVLESILENALNTDSLLVSDVKDEN